jgi:MFS family permease
MDNIIESVGEFGKFQKCVLLIVGLLSALSSATIYATIFTAAEPPFQCSHRSLKPDPPPSSSIDGNSILPSHNNSFMFNSSSLIIENDTCKVWASLLGNRTYYSQHYECHFDRQHYRSTIITEWELVCDTYWLAALTQTIQMFGSIFGFCGGIIGDRYGRRTSTLLFAVSLTVTLVVSQFLLIPYFEYSLSYKYAIYSVSQFMIGLLVNCLYCTAYILLMELTTERYRTNLANLNSYMYVCGELLVAIVYYYSRSWHFLNWFIAFTSLLVLVLSWLYLPESPAYLISVDRMDEALRTLNKIARFNGRQPLTLESGHFERIKEQEALLNNDSDESIVDAEKSKGEEERTKKKVIDEEAEEQGPKRFCERMGDLFMITNLFTPRKVFIKTAILFYVWIALLLLYYGISLGVTEEAEQVDPYLMYFLSCVAEVNSENQVKKKSTG